MDYPIISTQWHYRESESLHLDDCPFCGESELAYIGRETPVGKRYSVNCFGCMTEMNPGYCQTKQQIHDLWNKRKEQNRMTQREQDRIAAKTMAWVYDIGRQLKRQEAKTDERYGRMMTQQAKHQERRNKNDVDNEII